MGYSTAQIREKGINAYYNGESVTSISKIFSINRSTVYRWLNAFENTKTVERKSTPGSGRPRKLSSKDINNVVEIIKTPATNFGFETELWTMRRIIITAKKKFGIKLSKSTLHRILCEKEQSYKKPETRYYEANQEQQQEWINETLPKIKECVKKYNAILYFEDEANVSLACAVGKTWGSIGQKTIIKVTGNRGSVSAISAISKNGNLIFNIHEEIIRSPEIIKFLQQMLLHHVRRHIVVVMDQAKPHTSAVTTKFIESQKRLHIFYLPPRSPELNADEKVWNHLKNEELKAHKATNKKELKKLTRNKLRQMSNKPSLLRGIFWRSEIASLL